MSEKEDEKRPTKDEIIGAIEELDYLKQVIYERRQKLYSVLKEMKEEEKKTKEQEVKPEKFEKIPPSDRQIAYALFLAGKAGEKLDEEKLKKMDKLDVSLLIEQLKKKIEDKQLGKVKAQPIKGGD